MIEIIEETDGLQEDAPLAESFLIKEVTRQFVEETLEESLLRQYALQPDSIDITNLKEMLNSVIREITLIREKLEKRLDFVCWMTCFDAGYDFEDFKKGFGHNWENDDKQFSYVSRFMIDLKWDLEEKENHYKAMLEKLNQWRKNLYFDRDLAQMRHHESRNTDKA